MPTSLVDLQATLAFEQALKSDTDSLQLAIDAQTYESFGWFGAAAGTMKAAQRLSAAEQMDQSQFMGQTLCP